VRTAVKTAVDGLKLNGSSPHEIRLFEGQVGQESHLRPAVVAPAALRSATFREVQDQPSNRPF
jgi:hypothetical protein